jgi:ribosome-associated protein
VGLRFSLTVLGAGVDRSGDSHREHSEQAGERTEEKSSSDQESRLLALALARECWETKGEDLILLHVAPLVYWTQYMIIVTVFSKPQLGAMLAKVEKAAEEMFGRRPAQPAQGRSSWELLDFGDVVVNVLTADQREYYDLVR